MIPFKKFRDGVAFPNWHLADPVSREAGTAIRWKLSKRRGSLFGISFGGGCVIIGFWWVVRFDLIAVHHSFFNP